MKNALATNPFLKISPHARLGFAIYFFFWRFIPGFAPIFAIESTELFQVFLISAFLLATELLLLLPILRNSFVGTPVGWLHPFVLTTLMIAAVQFIKDPGGYLLRPVFVWYDGALLSMHPVFTTWSTHQLLHAQLKLNLYTFLAVFFTYVGFKIRVKSFRYQDSEIILSVKRFVIMFCLFLIVALVFLQLQGGILVHIASFSQGRFGMRETSGQFIVFVVFLPYLLILLYLYKPAIIRSPWFLIAFMLSSFLQFIVTGGRSATFTPLILLLFAWMYVNRRLPVIRLLASGVVFFLALGILGDIRSSGKDGSVDFSLLINFNIEEAYSATKETIENRNKSTNIAVFGLVPNEVDYLYGTTYLAAIGFWIPRAIWKSKPRGGGAHAAAIIFGGLATADGYRGASYPISGVAEVYWNFGLPGVIVIFLIYGAILRAICNWVICQPNNPLASIFLLVSVFSFGVSTEDLVPTLQIAIMLVISFSFARLRVRPRPD